MSYETDAMRALSAFIKKYRGLKYTLKEFNSNINVLKALTIELAKANELKEIELGIRSKEEYSYKTKTRIK